VCASRKASRLGEDAVPYKVILLKKDREIGSRECETRTEALAYAEARQSFQPDGTAVIIVDHNQQIVFTTSPAKDSNAVRP
jgi:hypothetical protein